MTTIFQVEILTYGGATSSPEARKQGNHRQTTKTRRKPMNTLHCQRPSEPTVCSGCTCSLLLPGLFSSRKVGERIFFHLAQFRTKHVGGKPTSNEKTDITVEKQLTRQFSLCDSRGGAFGGPGGGFRGFLVVVSAAALPPLLLLPGKPRKPPLGSPKPPGPPQSKKCLVSFFSTGTTS